MDNKLQLTTRAVDLLGPADRFTTTTRLRGRLHRWHLVWRKYWWVVFLILAVVVGPVYFFTASALPTYESRARMWLAGKLDLSEGHLYTEDINNFLGTQAELLSSPVIQQRAFAGLNARLQEMALRSAQPRNELLQLLPGGLTAAWNKFLAQTSGPAANTQRPFPFKVKVTESAKSSMLELRATGTEPQSTRAFLDCLMAEYLEFKRESREKTSDQTVASVSGQVTQWANELKTQQERLYNFQRSNNVVFFQEQGSSAASYLGMVNKQLASLRTELQFLQMVRPEQWIQLNGRISSPGAGDGAGSDGRDA